MPFRSKAQQRFMFAKHPRIAERWADHTPDMKELPEKLSKAKTAGFWMMMTKLGAVDPAIRKNLERVAKRMGVDPPSAADLERMFPKGWEVASQGSWQAQLEKSEWLRDANSAKMHAKDVAAGRAYPGSWHTSHGPGWSSMGKTPWYSGAARGILRHPNLYGVAGLLSMLSLESGTRGVRREARKGLSEKEFNEAVRKTTGRGTLAGMAAGGVLGAGIPILANLPGIRRAGGLGKFIKNVPGALSGLTGSGAITSLYSVPWGGTAGGLIGSRFLPGAAEKIRERKKTASEEEPVIPKNYLTKKLLPLGATGGAVSGALNEPMQVVLKRLDHFKSLKQKPSVGSLFRNMPKGTGKKMLGGGLKGAVGGALSAYLTGQFADHLIQKKLEENSV